MYIYSIKCENCGKYFYPKANQKFCSNKCRIEFHNKHNLQEVNCLNCGKKFLQNAHTQKFCSAECRNKYNYSMFVKTNKTICQNEKCEHFDENFENNCEGWIDVTGCNKRFTRKRSDYPCDYCKHSFYPMEEVEV